MQKKMDRSKSRPITIKEENAYTEKKPEAIEKISKETIVCFFNFTYDCEAMCVNVYIRNSLKYTISYNYHDSNIMQKNGSF